ncbi:NAD(P)H-dependent oxidoreductase [Leucobacter allii]|uniref:FMN-dependent NADH-azoreductase n=1 Tax=Leucobacter allii TaxID=2932247 RepID=UPI001FD2D715|nr:NAD(P)H-dependent oxidoreductase [Leucobacter allii]UOR01318.1 NAD(P)H-dependent oxidoreductase [Leucobacter allii]
MPALLHIDTSVDGERSRTRRLTAALADAWRARGPEYTVVARDLHLDPPPVMTASAQHWPERLRGGELLEAGVAAAQAAAIDELLAADAVVIGVPMYNYAMPATLKAWIDLVHVPGVTAPFDVDAQPLAGRAAVLIGARGGSDEDGGFAHALGSLELTLREGFGMDTRVVTTSRTLAHRVPELGPQLAADEFEAASARARALGASL